MNVRDAEFRRLQSTFGDDDSSRGQRRPPPPTTIPQGDGGGIYTFSIDNRHDDQRRRITGNETADDADVTVAGSVFTPHEARRSPARPRHLGQPGRGTGGGIIAAAGETEIDDRRYYGRLPATTANADGGMRAPDLRPARRNLDRSTTRPATGAVALSRRDPRTAGLGADRDLSFDDRRRQLRARRGPDITDPGHRPARASGAFELTSLIQNTAGAHDRRRRQQHLRHRPPPRPARRTTAARPQTMLPNRPRR